MLILTTDLVNGCAGLAVGDPVLRGEVPRVVAVLARWAQAVAAGVRSGGARHPWKKEILGKAGGVGGGGVGFETVDKTGFCVRGC